MIKEVVGNQSRKEGSADKCTTGKLKDTASRCGASLGQ